MTFRLALVVFFWSTTVWAENRVGNGGDVVVCGEGAQQTVELLDTYEAREVYGLPLELDDAQATEELIALSLAQRLHSVAPARAQMFETYLKNFAAETRFVDWDLEDVPDHGFIRLPAGCRVKQLIVNQCEADSDSFFDLTRGSEHAPVIEERVMKWNQVCKGRYRIDRRYWVKLSKVQRALAMTHEAFMRDYRHTGDPDYQFDGPFHPVRYFNSLVFSNKIAAHGFRSFQKLYGVIGRLENAIEKEDGRLVLGTDRYFTNGGVQQVVPFVKIKFGSYLFGLYTQLPLVLKSSKVEYTPDGEIAFETSTPFQVLRNPRFSADRWSVWGKFRGGGGGRVNPRDELVISSARVLEFPDSVAYRPGWERSELCDEPRQGEAPKPPAQEVRIASISYSPIDQSRRYVLRNDTNLKTSYANVVIHGGSSVYENYDQNQSCEAGIDRASFISIENVTGEVLTDTGRVTIYNKTIYVSVRKGVVTVR